MKRFSWLALTGVALLHFIASGYLVGGAIAASYAQERGMPNFRWGLTPVVLVLLLWGTAAGQDSGRKGSDGTDATQDADDEVRTARVVIDGEPLFLVRGATARPADRRARDIADRIRSIASDPNVDAKSLVIDEHPRATLILARGQRIMAVLDEELSHSRYIAGDAFSVADITALVALDFCKPARIQRPDTLQNLARWYAEVSARPSAKA